MDFERTRKRLYRLSAAINALVLPAFLFAIAKFGSAAEPIAQWPAGFARFFTPGLPANLIEAGLKFPVQTIVLVLVIGAVYRMNRVVKLEDDEHAFQTWLRLRMAAPSPIPNASRTARFIAKAAGSWWLWPILVLLALALPLGSLSDESGLDSAERATKSASPKPESPCAGVCGPRRLGLGEIARVMVVAKRNRNRTGLLLAKDETYTARFIASDGWRDGDYVASPRGVEFEGLTRYLAKGMEWLRPYPHGAWFQLIGRIDRGRDIFPILNQDCPEKPFAFQAPDDGELVLLVNDVIYGNNRGFMTVEIEVGSAP